MVKSRTYADEAEVPEVPAGGSDGAGAPAPISAEDAKTEQEKNPNSDPVGKAVPIGVEKAEQVAVGAKEPYPTGSPPSAEDEYRKIHGKAPPPAA